MANNTLFVERIFVMWPMMWLPPSKLLDKRVLLTLGHFDEEDDARWSLPFKQ